jgi:3-hydroxyethyl bacteriochlorophyllide a dehydrogenase
MTYIKKGPEMQTQAIIFQRPRQVELAELVLNQPGEADLVVLVEYSGISTGTERLLWSGTMPDFPGMGYPLVPGYEAAGRVIEAGKAQAHRVGDYVFVPGAACFGPVRGLFGASASRLVVPAARAVTVQPSWGPNAVLLALAATAFHASAGAAQPDLIIGHGVVGRLLARIAVLNGAAPTVWETNPIRREGAAGYTVIAPEDDGRKNYQHIFDASGSETILDSLIQRLAPGGEITLAGFYNRPSFAFAPAFMREAKFRIAAQWQPSDLAAVQALVEDGRLSLDGLITHHAAPGGAAYETAFEDAACLKMILDWN